MYKIKMHKRAKKDLMLLKAAGLEQRTRELLALITENPFINPPPYEALVGKLSGLYSRRLSYQHRMIYYVDEDQKEILIQRMWTHYETVHKL